MEETGGFGRFSVEIFERHFLAVAIVAAVTAAMLLIGRELLGEGVIALLYLAPVSWVTARWGQAPGISAAVSAALAFNFFFIPPYYTLYIGSLEGWLLLAIFLLVAIVVVGRIQVGLAKAQMREREAIFLYELLAAFAATRTPAAVGRLLAEKIQQLYQAGQVLVTIDGVAEPFRANPPTGEIPTGSPDRLLPMLAGRNLLGEIRIWHGKHGLPPANDQMLVNFANQGGLALARARLSEQGAA